MFFFNYYCGKEKLLSMARIPVYIFASKFGINGRYFVTCLFSGEPVLLYKHWFVHWHWLFYLLTSVTPVDKISTASSNSLCDLRCENYLVSLCSLPVWCRWSLSKAIQCCKFLAGRKHFTVDTEVLVQTSHPLPRDTERLTTGVWKLISCLLSWHQFS